MTEQSEWNCGQCGEPAKAESLQGPDPLTGEKVVTPEYYITC